MSSQALLTELKTLLPLDDVELREVLNYTSTLNKEQAARHLSELLGETPEAITFISNFNDHQTAQHDIKSDFKDPADAAHQSQTTKASTAAIPTSKKSEEQAYAPPPGQPPIQQYKTHTNIVSRAAALRAHDEQDIQQQQQVLQFKYGIYNTDIEPEHECEYYCRCDIHQLKYWKLSRAEVQTTWSKAVMYPGEKSYADQATANIRGFGMFTSNPYFYRVTTPYGGRGGAAGSMYSVPYWNGPSRPVASYYTQTVRQTIELNNRLNAEAQEKVNNLEPKYNIWEEDPLKGALEKLNINENEKKSKLKSFRQSIGIKNAEEKAVSKASKATSAGLQLRQDILTEEQGRWPDENWRMIAIAYQQHIGIAGKVRELRTRQPLQYLHLLRAGYLEPIPVAWANSNSNPLKFSIDGAGGWRGITPQWRGYEDTAEERLYWVLNHRDGAGTVLKPDFMSAMRMAQERMAQAVEPPPAYYTADDTCHVQHKSEGYSPQVMPPPFHAFDRPETPNDDTMILLDVSGSMQFDPQRPIYHEYLITGYAHTNQPKNKDVAKAIVRRFTDAIAAHDHATNGYDLVTFSDRGKYIGAVDHSTLDQVWGSVRFGGQTRVMTGWQKVKELHFQKHSESATYHPVYGWQAGPQTPMLRLLLLLDGEAQDMDEFEADLLSLSWAHVTVFLIGADGCLHHHRHANELARISAANHHVSFVDAVGNFPERFVTHELLKRHLGYDMSMQEFESIEALPAYSAF